MYTLHDEDTVLRHLQKVFLIFTFPGNKIIRRELHFFTLHQLDHMFFKKLQIKRIERLIVFLPFFIERSFVSINKIIIKRNTYRSQQIYQQLYFKSFAKCSLSG